MNKNNLTDLRVILVFTVLVMVAGSAYGQSSIPSELINNPAKDQLNYLEQKTRIYENYRAIREDLFQKIKLNITDTLTAAKNDIISLKNERSELNHTIDSLSDNLEATKLSLEEMTRTKNSINVIGIEVNKTSYNSIMWIIVAGLLAVLAFGFLAFKRNLTVTAERKSELNSLKSEFETYRKSAREAREKMSMDHFKEIQKLKGG
jgi:hypothetical protein